MRPYFEFLSALAKNNHRDWMMANKKWYEETRAEFLDDVAYLIKGLNEFVPGMDIFKPKDCVFRINRDVRFSKNKDPYKTNFSAYFSPKGKKSPGPGYYVSLKPGDSMVGGGIWMPEAENLKRIRKEIDYSGAELQAIEEDPYFKKNFGEINGERLKTSPRDYDKEHTYIKYLRLKSFTAFTKLEDKDVESGAYLNKALDAFRKMVPLNNFLERAIEDVEDGSGIL